MSKYCIECGSALARGAKFCTNCGTAVSAEADKPRTSAFSDKRARVLGQDRKKDSKLFYVIVPIGLLLLFGLWSFMEYLPNGSNPVIEQQPQVKSSQTYPNSPTRMAFIQASVSDGIIRVPLAEVEKRHLVRFEYKTNGLVIPLLAYISQEGQLVTAISMCEPCNSTTFHIRAENLICNSCGTTWELDNLNGVSGSCQKFPPDPIPSRVVEGQVEIEASIVANWQRRV